MALARLPDSKRDSNTKSSVATCPVEATPPPFGWAFIKYLALPMHDRLNCVTSKQLSYDLLCALILTFNCASGGGALCVTCADDWCNGWAPVAAVPSTPFPLMPFEPFDWGLPGDRFEWHSMVDRMRLGPVSLDCRSSSSSRSSSDELFELSPFFGLYGFTMRSDCGGGRHTKRFRRMPSAPMVRTPAGVMKTDKANEENGENDTDKNHRSEREKQN